MENNTQTRQAFFEDITPCGDGYSIINGQKVHVDSLTETEAVGSTEGGDWFAAKKDFGLLRYELTTARADWVIGEEEQHIPIETRVREFMDAHDKAALYTVEHFSSWFRRLTGACMTGRNEFIRTNGLSHNDLCTARFFLDLVVSKGVAGGVLKELQEAYADSESIYRRKEATE